MPKLKASPGKIQLSTPIMEEFQRWLCYELVNSKEWNKNLIEGGMIGMHRWKFVLKVHGVDLWTIQYDGQRIHVTSDEPIVTIRKGLLIRMGSGRLELE